MTVPAELCHSVNMKVGHTCFDFSLVSFISCELWHVYLVDKELVGWSHPDGPRLFPDHALNGQELNIWMETNDKVVSLRNPYWDQYCSVSSSTPQPVGLSAPSHISR